MTSEAYNRRVKKIPKHIREQVRAWFEEQEKLHRRKKKKTKFG